MSARRGFNLIEVAVASVMAGVIGIAAIGSFASLNRQLVTLQAESTTNDAAKSLIDHLITDMQGVGGGPIRPWMGLWVENGATAADAARDAVFLPPSTVRSDRVTFATLIEAAPSCRIVSMDGTGLQGELVKTLGRDECCLEAMFANASVAENATVMLAYLVTNTKHRQVALTRGVGCKATVAPGPLAAVDITPGFSIAKPDTNFVGGTVVAAKVRTIFLSATNLFEFSQLRNFSSDPPSMSDGTLSVVSSGVYDFQVQLGYDTGPDRRVDDRNALDDEWLYNLEAELGTGGVTFDPTALRMVGVGAVVGIRVSNPGAASRAQVIGGAEVVRGDVYLRAAMGRASLRNLFIFN